MGKLCTRGAGRLAAAALVAFAAAIGPSFAGSGKRILDPSQLESWRLPDPDLYAVTARGEQVVAVGYWGTVLVSSDAGETFRYAETPTREALFDVSFGTAEHGWAVGRRGVILRTEDAGASWTRQPVSIRDSFGDEVALDSSLFGVYALSETEAWAVGDLGVVLHTRNGVDWDQVLLSEESFGDDNLVERILNSVRFLDEQTGYVAGEFGTVLRTADAGTTWTGEHELSGAPRDLYLFGIGLGSLVRAADEAPAGEPGAVAAAVSLAGTVVVSADGGAHWEARPIDTDVGLYGVAAHGPRAVVAGDRGKIFTTQDAGRSWVEAEYPRRFGWLSGVAFAGPTRVFVVGARGSILRSDDAGRRFRPVELARGESETQSLARTRIR